MRISVLLLYTMLWHAVCRIIVDLFVRMDGARIFAVWGQRGGRSKGIGGRNKAHVLGITWGNWRAAEDRAEGTGGNCHPALPRASAAHACECILCCIFRLLVEHNCLLWRPYTDCRVPTPVHCLECRISICALYFQNSSSIIMWNPGFSTTTRSTSFCYFSKYENARYTFSREFIPEYPLLVFYDDTSYIYDIVTPVTWLPGPANLRSAHQGNYDVPRIATGLGQRSFAVAGPKA